VDIVTIRYKAEMQKEWDDFVWESRNGTIFHTQKFLSYHSPGKFEDCSLLFKNKEKIMAVLPAAILRNKEVSLRSHPGSSYGGLILSHKADSVIALEVLRLLIEFAKKSDYSVLQIDVAPSIYQNYPCEELDFALHHLGFEYAYLELSSAIYLPEGEEKWWGIFKEDTARSITKALENNYIEVRESGDWECYWKILEENLKRHNAISAHSLEEILKLKKLFPDKIRLTASYLDNRMTAGVVCFMCNKRAFITFYHAQDYEYQQYRSMNLILYRLMEWGFREKYEYMVLGISTEEKGQKINWGLFRFKEGFGGRGVLRRHYRLELK